MQGEYVDGEGGDRGIVLSYIPKRINKATFSGGCMINSFGKPSLLLSGGYIFKIEDVESTISVGVMGGYQVLFEDNSNTHKLPPFMEKNGLIPILVYSIKFPVYKNLGVQANVSPVFLNYGAYFNIK